MRRTSVALLALATVLLGAVPASAVSADTGGGTGKGWEPAPSAPWDVTAGVRCDFPVHGEPVVDEVVQRVLDTYPDGSAKRVAYKGDLVVRVTNTGTGASYDADASGTAVVDYRTDGSQFWSVRGPVLVGVGENGGNLPRGLYIIDGVYTLDIGSTGYKTVTMASGTQDDLCARID
ncbi:hypothetical protein H1V43_29715 [Streptomyces sp. PSKA54]|uniref:Secreted protein n=1 Tax=Streptomyces himalayensis subsp. aureolus TaxID=2758039 RepID=A0A7W2HIU6_9ACTN|nr:hypothetical protein [Streptomyces himalayensis]MBA4865442.1 hypothetical protein [Streptomyces himalayensis subsp. aureolus]